MALNANLTYNILELCPRLETMDRQEILIRVREIVRGNLSYQVQKSRKRLNMTSESSDAHPQDENTSTPQQQAIDNSAPVRRIAQTPPCSDNDAAEFRHAGDASDQCSTAPPPTAEPAVNASYASTPHLLIGDEPHPRVEETPAWFHGDDNSASDTSDQGSIELPPIPEPAVRRHLICAGGADEFSPLCNFRQMLDTQDEGWFVGDTVICLSEERRSICKGRVVQCPTFADGLQPHEASNTASVSVNTVFRHGLSTERLPLAVNDGTYADIKKHMLLYWPVDLIVSEESAPNTPARTEDSAVAVDSFVAVAYDKTWYVGRVLEVNSDDATITFMKRRAGKFVWPSREDRDRVNREFILPTQVYLNEVDKVFTVNNCDEIDTLFKEFMS